MLIDIVGTLQFQNLGGWRMHEKFTDYWVWAEDQILVCGVAAIPILTI